MFRNDLGKRSVISLALSTLLLACAGDGKKDEPKEELVDNTDNTSSQVQAETYPSDKVTVSNDWLMVWNDEFDSTAIDLSKWSFEVNCYGGGNDEQQCYTDRADNASIQDGKLIITAKHESFTGPAAHDDAEDYDVNVTRNLPYTSARLRSKGKGDWTYGRFEIRAKLPSGQGSWPAIWMLPTEWAYGGWAGSGEIDIMEAVNLGTKSDEQGVGEGSIETRIHGTLHYGAAWPNNVYTGAGFRQEGVNPADDFHVYAVEWEKNEIRWYMDDIHYATQTADGWYTQYNNDSGELVTGTGDAPFDQKFHLLLNFAVGGNWPSNVNAKGEDSSAFPQTFEIDYVRVYECQANAQTGQGCAAIGDNPKIVAGKSAPQ